MSDCHLRCRRFTRDLIKAEVPPLIAIFPYLAWCAKRGNADVHKLIVPTVISLGEFAGELLAERNIPDRCLYGKCGMIRRQSESVRNRCKPDIRGLLLKHLITNRRPKPRNLSGNLQPRWKPEIAIRSGTIQDIAQTALGSGFALAKHVDNLARVRAIFAFSQVFRS